MSENSAIEWCDHTFNPWMGCTKVGPGCDHCYAETLMDTRYGKVHWGVGQPRLRTAPANWRKPLAWQKNAAAFQLEHGRRQRVFCASLADVFDNEVGKGWREDLFALIHATPNLDWLLLTKRIGNADRMIEDAIVGLELAEDGPRWPWPNVWLGATIVNREELMRDATKLKATPAHVHFWSYEPALGDLGEIPPGLLPSWVIAGGESGPHARPMHPDWARGLRDQCAAAGVPFLFKQWGEWAPWEPKHPAANVDYLGVDGTHNTGPGISRAPMAKVGKKAAGRLLGGVQHDGFPA